MPHQNTTRQSTAPLQLEGGQASSAERRPRTSSPAAVLAVGGQDVEMAAPDGSSSANAHPLSGGSASPRVGTSNPHKRKMEEQEQAAISNKPKRAQLQDPPPVQQHARPQQQQQLTLPDDHSSQHHQTQHPSPLSLPPQKIIKSGSLDQSRQKLNLTVRPRAAGSDSEKSENRVP